MNQALHRYNPHTVANKHFLITGATGGIGMAAAARALSDGAKVTLLGRAPERVAALTASFTDDGFPVLGMCADVRDQSAIREVVVAAEEAFGTIDVLVNSAGVAGEQGPLVEADLNTWWSEFEINVRGVTTCMACVLPSMLTRARGRIINLVSGTAGRPSPYNSAYAASKAAVVRLTDSVNSEVSPHGVTVFAFRPGNVQSKMTDQFRSSPAVQRWLPGELARLTPAAPDLAASGILWLASGRGDALAGRWLDADQDLHGIAADAARVNSSDMHQLRRTVWSPDGTDAPRS